MAKSSRKSQKLTAGITELQYNESLAKFAANDTKLASLAAEMEEEIQAIREEFDGDINILEAEQKLLMAVIKGYCVANRDSIFPEKKKSIDSLYGTLGFRNGTPALRTVSKGITWENVLAKLKELKLTEYIRTVEEPNKEKLLADRNKEEVVKHFPDLGVVVKQEESFYIDLKKEEVATAAA